MTAMIEESYCVGVWMKSAGIGSGDERFEILQQFCDEIGMGPDELISSCLTELEDGSKKIRMKRRRDVAERIKEFEGDGSVGLRRGNVVRSFLIHNGVSVQASRLLS